MKEEKLVLRYPKDLISIETYAHQVMNYRYHWHPEDYEISVLLDGKLEYCRGNETALMEADDLICTSPGTGHASFSLVERSQTIVIHFSASSLRPYIRKGSTLHFPECRSNETNRNEHRYKMIRYYAAQIYSLAHSDSPYAQPACKAAIEGLISVLCLEFNPVIAKGLPEADQQQELMRTLSEYLEKHYMEKVTLEDLAEMSGYNRTYVSTLFKNILNVNLHEYLSRIRFRHALTELAYMDKPLTEIALSNGFSDLKTFNTKFREFLHRSPAEYRSQLLPNQNLSDEILIYLPHSDPVIQNKLKEYMNL